MEKSRTNPVVFVRQDHDDFACLAVLLQMKRRYRILPGLPLERQQAVRSALEAFFESYVTPEGVVALPAAFWVVQARVCEGLRDPKG